MTEGGLPSTLKTSSSSVNRAVQPFNVPSNDTGDANRSADNTGTLKLQYSYSEDDTQKDPDTSVDGFSQSQPDRGNNPSSNIPPSLNRPPSAGLDASVAKLPDMGNNPSGSIPPTFNRPPSAGLDALVAELQSQEKITYFDESRRFGSPEKLQQTPATPGKAMEPLAGLSSAIKGVTPMGLTQLFTTTQDSPIRPLKQISTLIPPSSLVVASSTPDSPLSDKPPERAPMLSGKVSTPSEDINFSFAEPMETRPKRIDRGRRVSRIHVSSEDEELTMLFDGEVRNRRTRRAIPAKRRGDDEVNKVYQKMKVSRTGDGGRDASNKSDQTSGQALKSIAKENTKESTSEAKERGFAAKKAQTASQKNAQDRARVIAERRMRSRNFPTDDTTTDDEDSPPLPFTRPAPIINRRSERTSSIQSAQPQNVRVRRNSPEVKKSSEPFGPSDWEVLHNVSRSIPDGEPRTSFQRKHPTPVAPEIPPPPETKRIKPSIRNMPPFNIPLPQEIPLLSTERPASPVVPFRKIYPSSSDLFMLTKSGTGGSCFSHTSSPPLPLQVADATSTQVERSPSQSGDVEIVASQPRALTPQLCGVVGLDEERTIPETSPISEKNMTSVPYSPTSNLIVPDTDSDSNEIPIVTQRKGPSPHKRKRDEMPIKAICGLKFGETCVPSSMPSEGPAFGVDGEGSIMVDEAEITVPTERDRTCPPENESDECPKKRHKTERTKGAEGTKYTIKAGAHEANLEKEFKSQGARAKTSTPTVSETTNLKVPSSTKGKAFQLTKSASTSSCEKHAKTPMPAVEAEISANFYAARRVFALFRGREMYYHPATVVPGPRTSISHYKVEFDDGTEVATHKDHVRQLTLIKGDIIKCDIVNMKTKFWVVVGFPELRSEGSTSPLDQDTPDQDAWRRKLVDTSGHQAVLLKEKKKGTPLGNNTHNMSVTGNKEGVFDWTTGEPKRVPITKIYLTKSLWTQFRERVYNHEFGPPEGTTAAVFDTPSKDRRPSPSSLSKYQPSGAQLNTNPNKVGAHVRPGGIFFGMVFALSFGDNESKKKGIIDKILGHGGRILDDGFDEMFRPFSSVISNLRVSSRTASTSPNSSETEKDADSVYGDYTCLNTNIGLQFAEGTESVGFACVIADKYSRRVKFLQALALGIPCLSGKWIEDCIKDNSVIDWDLYLLPAGESTYLSGAIRSRILPTFPAATSRFIDIVDRRKKLLDGHNVLLVIGKGKVGEKKKPYRFLIYAMGATKVKAVVSIEEANGALKDGLGLVDSGVAEVGVSTLASPRWDLVYLDAGGTKGARGAREKLSREKLWAGVPRGQTRPRVVDDEWVVQSLIFGKLLDEQ